MLGLEAKSKFNAFCTNIYVKRAIILACTCTNLLLCKKPLQWSYRHFFKRFQTEQRILTVNKSKIIGEKTLNGDHFGTERNHELNNDEKTLFGVFYQICDKCFIPLTAKYVYLRFSKIVSFLQVLSQFLLGLEARSDLIAFYTKFSVQRAIFLPSTCTSLLLCSKPVH